MDPAAARELVFVLLSITFFFVLAMIAVALFYRQWLRERADKPLRRNDKTKKAPPLSETPKDPDKN